jgi:AcrR family transcriptional regulator
LAVQSPAPSRSRKPPSGEKALRADAQRNRDKLIDAAATAFAEHGVEASLEEIARSAGVGIGTLYRHFPTREHLVEVVYSREVELLCAAADELAERERPDVALEQWMQRFVGYIATKRGMANSLQLLYATNSQLFAKTSGMVPQALHRLVEAAAAAGLIRRDIESADVLQAMSGIYSAPNSPDWRERSRRLVRLLMDGLRSGARKK